MKCKVISQMIIGTNKYTLGQFHMLVTEILQHKMLFLLANIG